MFKWVVLAIAFLFSLAVKADVADAEPSWFLFKTGSYTLPYGNSRSPFFQYQPSLDSTWVRVEYSGAGCDAVAYGLEVRTAPNTALVSVSPEAGVFKTPGPKIFEYRILARQTSANQMLCTERVFLARAPVVQTSTFEFLGSIQFTGGSFAVALPVATQDRVSQVWVERPSFCKDVEIRGVDFVTNGIPYPAKVADKLQNIYEIDGGAGARITHVQVLLAGPFTTQCQLGVHLKTVK